MSEIDKIHVPVLLDECIELVTGNFANLERKNPVIVDCTLGLAGHSTAFLSSAASATVIGIDRDGQALELASQRVEEAGFADRFIPVHSAFDSLGEILDNRNIAGVDAVFMDLGLSSLQIDETERGFSYSKDSALDMRMDKRQSKTAQTIVDTYSAEELTRIFREYGEEKFSAAIARAIVSGRENGERISSSAQLVKLADEVIPRSRRPAGNPAKRIFQALRIEVNGELNKLASTLPQAALHLNVGGRIVVESYHSLEDKIVKKFMRKGIQADVPARIPVIPEEAKPFFSDVTRGALKADSDEISDNPRSASVRLRAVELIREIPESKKAEFAKEAAGEKNRPQKLKKSGKLKKPKKHR